MFAPWSPNSSSPLRLLAKLEDKNTISFAMSSGVPALLIDDAVIEFSIKR